MIDKLNTDEMMKRRQLMDGESHNAVLAMVKIIEENFKKAKETIELLDEIIGKMDIADIVKLMKEVYNENND